MRKRLNKLAQDGLFMILVSLAAIAATLIGCYVSSWRGFIVIGFAAGAMATFMFALEAIYWLYGIIAGAALAGLGIAADASNRTSNLHVNFAFYALALFLALYIVVGDTQNLYVKTYATRLARLAWLSSLVIAIAVPLRYGTGTAPMLFTAAYLLFVNSWSIRELAASKKLKNGWGETGLVAVMTILVIVGFLTHVVVLPVVLALMLACIAGFSGNYAKLSLRTA